MDVAFIQTYHKRRVSKLYAEHTTFFYVNKPPVPTRLINWALVVWNSFQFMEGHYLQTHGMAMHTKMALAFANIFMAKIESNPQQN